MKKSTLARRIGEKANEPMLEDYLLDQLTLDDLPPDRCFVWSGSRTQGGLQFHRRSQTATNRQPYPIIQFNGKIHYVQRILFPPPVPDKLINQCGNTLCINPHHWSPIPLPPPEPDPDTLPPPDLDEAPWTLEEAQEMLDLYFSTNPDQTSPDPGHPLLCDIPPQLLAQAHKRLRK